MSGCTEAQAVRVNNLCRQRNPQAVFFWSDMMLWLHLLPLLPPPAHRQAVELLSQLHQLDDRHRNPTRADEGIVRNILLNFQRESGQTLTVDTATGEEQNVLSDTEIRRLCDMSSCTSMMACSVLGSYLSQEVIKGVSATGAPGYNVFVFTGDDLVVKAIPIGTAL
eukprot:gene24037-30333_t